jgi:hypothetical protein
VIPHGQQLEVLLDQLHLEGDRTADEVVSSYFADVELAPDAVFKDMLDLPKDRFQDTHPAIAAYLAERPPLPTWADPDLLRQGSEFFRAWGPQLFLALYVGALPWAYSAHDGVQALWLTGRMRDDPKRRLLETAFFVTDVMTPYELLPGGRGYNSIRRVRLMHAAVRHLIEHDADPKAWEPAWGKPLNQQQLIGTLLTFTQVVFEVFERFGTPVPAAEAEAYVHTWSVVGHLLGVRSDLLPLDCDSAARLKDALKPRVCRASEAGQKMEDALLEVAQKVGPRGLRSFPASMTQFAVGDEIAAMIGIEGRGWSYSVIEQLARINGWIYRLPFVGAHSVWLSRTLGLGILREAVGLGRGPRPPYLLPESLARNWRLQRKLKCNLR